MIYWLRSYMFGQMVFAGVLVYKKLVMSQSVPDELFLFIALSMFISTFLDFAIRDLEKLQASERLEKLEYPETKNKKKNNSEN